MAKKMFPALAGIFSSLMPLLLIVGLFIVLLSSGVLKKLMNALTGIASTVGDGITGFKDVLQYGSGENKVSIEAQLEALAAAAKVKGIKPTESDFAIATQINRIINISVPWSFLVSSTLPQGDQKLALDLFINNSFQRMAGILLAYGERNAPYRLAFLQNLFDDTSGTLRDHVNRFFTGEIQKQFLHYIDYVTKNIIN